MAYNWQCPYCGRHASLTDNSYATENGYLATGDEGKDGNLNYTIVYLVCPNQQCKEYTLQIVFCRRVVEKDQLGNKTAKNGDEIIRYTLKPRGSAKPFPEFIPVALREDYTESCLILQDSPKASATLARRCLQGIIRSYYGITKISLYEEITALKDRVSADLWTAIDAIREVGNVGAHSEKDVSTIVDVSHEAARALIGLIELLFNETYVKDHDRQERIDRAVNAAKGIKEQKSCT